ncbi:protein RISC-INTERACTING CLEARING 3'-5' EXORIBONUCLEASE 2-like [Lathyrus oleraceus]|uniref:protein RISC-INTERACTING CLEARING 3'-5' EXORIBONUCLEASE 2-like n=1 Tax=Pisum sativum TaxID=3888 RepID=UPI0021D26696|nr:protein RISC-INTERACTING CLEARING 3'-5' EXORIBONUCLEASE 2-like [Pisum sativum]
MGHIGSFELNGVHIQTRATSNEKEIENHISSFLRPSHNHRTKVIGFDAEWFLLDGTEPETITKSKCATIQLCDGHSCLIIQLNQFNSFESDLSSHRVTCFFNSLLNLFSLPDYTFVGVGMKHNLAKLEQQCGIGCKNAVELGPLAATLMNRPRLSYCGVDELAFVVNNLDLRKHRPLNMDFNWGSDLLSTELVKLAAVNVYSYYKIGSTLLGCDASFSSEPSFDIKVDI